MNWRNKQSSKTRGLNMRSLHLLPLGLLALSFCARETTAQAVTYDVSVNTSSLAGTTGSLDFNFNPGPLISPTASLQILGLSTNGAFVGSPTLTGNVSGALPTTVAFNNGSAFNDYFQGFKFGTKLSFDINLSGPALSHPGGATSGSTFAFSMFSNLAGTISALTRDAVNGFAVTASVNPAGTTSVTNFSPATTIGSGGMRAPEIDPASIVAAVTLLFGSLSVLRGGRKAGR
jgi:hypothetical protein